MARTWSTFNAPPQWGKMTGIPADLADGKIDWGEITGKPATYPHTPFSRLEFAEDSINFLDFNVRGGQPKVDFDARIIVYIDPGQPQANGYGIIQYQALKHFFYGNCFMFSLPSTSDGLATGQICSVSNGFLKAVDTKNSKVRRFN